MSENIGNINRRSVVRRVLATTLASAALSGCISDGKIFESEPESSIWVSPEFEESSATDTDLLETTTTTTTLPPAPECVTTEEAVLTEDYSSDLIKVEIPNVSFAEIEAIDESNPGISPEGFVNEYFDRSVAVLGETIDLELDQSLDLSSWPDIDSPTATTINLGEGKIITEKTQAQRTLARDIDSIMGQMTRYPLDLYKAFGVDRIRLADMYENYGGHYDTLANEIAFEYDQGAVDKAWVHTFLAHELAHAYHDKFCGGNIWNDPELSKYNSIDYLGYFNNEDSHEEIDEHYSGLDARLFSYGPEREFVQSYSTSSSAEDFATIVEWTFASRGMIQPTDEDYDSPLYHKQQLVVERLETMIPGSKVFLERLTTMLRLSPDNEVFAGEQARPVVELHHEDIISTLGDGQYAAEDPYLLNVVRAGEFSSNFPYATILEQPMLDVRRDYDENGPTGDYELQILSSKSELGLTINDVTSPRHAVLTMTVFVPSSDVEGGEYVGTIFAKASELGITDTEAIAYDVDMEAFMSGDDVYERLRSQNLVPITLHIIPPPTEEN